MKRRLNSFLFQDRRFHKAFFWGKKRRMKVESPEATIVAAFKKRSKIIA
jgi:hypothetical protein